MRLATAEVRIIRLSQRRRRRRAILVVGLSISVLIAPLCITTISLVTTALAVSKSVFGRERPTSRGRVIRAASTNCRVLLVENDGCDALFLVFLAFVDAVGGLS